MGPVIFEVYDPDLGRITGQNVSAEAANAIYTVLREHGWTIPDNVDDDVHEPVDPHTRHPHQSDGQCIHGYDEVRYLHQDYFTGKDL